MANVTANIFQALTRLRECRPFSMQKNLPSLNIRAHHIREEKHAALSASPQTGIQQVLISYPLVFQTSLTRMDFLLDIYDAGLYRSAVV